MTTRANRALVVALAAALSCSLALGAAAPVAAGGVLAGDGSSLQTGLGLGETIDDTLDGAGDVLGVDGENASPNGTVANATAANGTWENQTDNGTLANESDDGTAEPNETAGGPSSTPEPTPTDTDAAEPNDTDVLDVGATVEAVGDGAARAVNETADATTDTVDGTVNATGETVTETVNATGGAVDETVNATGFAATETVNGTGETVEGTTDATVGGVENVTGGITGTVTGVTAATTDGTANATTDATGTVDRTVSSTTGAVGNLTAADTDVTLTDVVEGTGKLVRWTTDAVTDTVDATVENTGTLLEGVVAGTVGHEEDSGTAGSHGWPTADGGSADDRDGSGAGDAAGGPTVERVDLAGGPAASIDDGTGDDADEAGGASDGDGLAPSGPFDPGAGGAAVGAALVVGSLVATRTGMAASTMGGATGLLQALVAALRALLFRVAVLAGYSRYDFEDPLENENRAAVLEAVESSPGINLTSLVEATDLSESTVRYHLRVLEHEDLLEGAKVRGRRRYVPRTDADVELLAAFEEEATKDVLAALFEHEPATGTTLAEALDRDPSTVSHHLSRLADAGLVDREQDGPALRNSLTPEVRRAFSEVEVTASVQNHAQADD